MKILPMTVVFLAIFLLLTACNQSLEITPSPTPLPTATLAPMATSTPSETATFIVPSTQTQIYINPTPLPKIEISQLVLGDTLSIQPLDGLNGYKTRKITGWDYGYWKKDHWWHRCGGYQWADENHLLLYPVVGQEPMEVDMSDEVTPVVINLSTGNFWLPPYIQNCDFPRWSPQLGLLVVVGENSVSTYTLDEVQVANYRGEMYGISPSGTKIIIAEDTLVDLSTKKTIDFNWHYTGDEYEGPQYFKPIWSSDENRVYRCCYHYGDIQTGKSYDFQYNELQTKGREIPGGYMHSTGQWVRDNSYLLVQWDYVNFSNPGFIPLFDPVAKTYYDLNELADIPAEAEGVEGFPYCQETSASPDGEHVWVKCYTSNYLVNVATFKSAAYPGEPEDVFWSTDGKFAYLSSQPLKILSVSSAELNELPANLFYESLHWHPLENTLAYLSEEKQTLGLLNTQAMSVQKLKLPTTFRDLVWSPKGERIALLAEDGSLWQVDYPKLQNLEQLTHPLANVRDVFWSADGACLAFVGGVDIYIVETIK